jgi:hypothetical protein
MPAKFTAPDTPIVTNDELFVPYSSNTYFATGQVIRQWEEHQPERRLKATAAVMR